MNQLQWHSPLQTENLFSFIKKGVLYLLHQIFVNNVIPTVLFMARLECETCYS